MAAPTWTFYRNYDSSDTTSFQYMNPIATAPSPEEFEWTASTGEMFKEWNTSRDGSGTSYAIGDDVSQGTYYAIWMEDVEYLTFKSELKSIADAIRTKGGTSSDLTYPSGFVSAIKAIFQGVDVSDTTATVNDVLKGKYFHTAAGYLSQGQISTKYAYDLSVSGKTVSIPRGYYQSDYTKDVADGSATTPATTITSNPSISVSSSGLITATNSKTQSVTPTVSAGYVSSGTAGTITVGGSNTSQLTVQSAQTITPTTSNQTITSGKYLTGTQTILGDVNLVAENIRQNKTIFGITGTYTFPDANGVSF